MGDSSGFNINKNDNTFYRKNIGAMFSGHLPVRVPNGAPEHAQIIFKAMLDNAKTHVKIFCRNLAANVFDSVVLEKAMKNALKGGVNVMVFTQEEPMGHNITALLKNTDGARIEKLTDPKYIKEETNFAIMDDYLHRRL